MRALIDTNVLLDHLLRREPHDVNAAVVWAAAERREFVAAVCAASFNNVYYVLRKTMNHEAAVAELRRIRLVFEIVPIDSVLIDDAMAIGVKDFEDALQAAAAVRAAASFVITRDRTGFLESPVPAIRPADFLAFLAP